MFRWLLVAAGAVILYVSFHSWCNLDPRPEDARPIGLNEAIESIQQRGVRFIKLPAMLDTSRRIYETGLPAPAYAAFPPHEVQPLAPTGELDPNHILTLMGSQVEVAGPLDPTALLIESLRHEKEGDGEQQKVSEVVMGHRVLAPLVGSDSMVLVLSPLHTDDEGADQVWFRSARFKGQLCSLDDVPKALGVPMDIESIRKKFSAMGAYLPNDAVVIMTEHQPKADLKLTPKAKHYVPVAGSDDRVFVMATDDQENAIDNAIIGVLEPANGAAFSEFEPILNADIHDRIGLLRVVSRDPEQDKAHLIVQAGFGSATTFIGLGVWLFYREHRRKLRELEVCRMAVKDPNLGEDEVHQVDLRVDDETFAI